MQLTAYLGALACAAAGNSAAGNAAAARSLLSPSGGGLLLAVAVARKVPGARALARSLLRMLDQDPAGASSFLAAAARLAEAAAPVELHGEGLLKFGKNHPLVVLQQSVL